jgi:CHAD domain-containing protein
VARAHEIPGLDCGEPFHRAAARVIAVRADEVLVHSEGVLDLERIEAVHDMRVATRRLRAAMEVFEPCFPRKRHRRALRRVRALADALGERRDRDVAIEFLEALGGQVSETDREALSVELERMRAGQRQANEDLVRFVRPKRLGRLRRRLRELEQAAR